MALPDVDLAFEPITRLAARLRQGSLSPVALAEHFLERIGTLDGKLHSYIVVLREQALEEARGAEAALKAGHDLGPLHGIPFAAKDLFDVKGAPTTAGTRLLAGNLARKDSDAVRLLREKGMVLLGKTHTIQLAFGVVGINNDQGTPHNPWQVEPHAPGGSSSGSGVAVSAGLAPAALGTDTGGSIRVPASLCGVVGLKTTVGQVSREGVYPLSWTLDSVGPLTRSVEDAALLYHALRGSGCGESGAPRQGPEGGSAGLRAGVRALRIAFGETLFFDDVDPEVERAVRAAGDVFRSLGARVESMEVPEVAAAWAERGRPFFVNAEACVINRELLDHHLDEMDPLVGPRMIRGRELSAPDYLGLLHRYRELQQSVVSTLLHVDALIVPTTAIAAPPLAGVAEDSRAYVDLHFRLHRNAGLGNILNLCAVSLPCGFTSKGLPIGLTVYARPCCEDMALRVAHAYERATEWHRRRPGLA